MLVTLMGFKSESKVCSMHVFPNIYKIICISSILLIIIACTSCCLLFWHCAKTHFTPLLNKLS